MNQDNLPQTNENPQPSDNTEERTLSLLQKIKAGTLDSKSIRPADRRMLVSYLMADGYSTADIAQILKVSDRSIERDKKTIREANILTTDPKLTEQMAGRLYCEAELSIQRIRKAARDKDASALVKIDAENRCWQITHDLILSLQRLGFLPIATQHLQADFTHSIAQVPDFSFLKAEAERLTQIASQSPDSDPQLMEQLAEFGTQIVKVDLASKLQNISKQLPEQGS